MTDLAVIVPSAELMRALGAAFGRVAVAGDRFFLEGPFGAGKTTFVQGLAVGLDVPTPISSPSFVIETQHRGRLTLYHIDLYRLEVLDGELLGELEEHLYGDGVAAVEWSERLPSALRADGVVLRFSVTPDGQRVVALASDEARLRGALAQ